MRRFDPAYVRLKAAVADGACAAPLLLHCVSRGVSAWPGANDELTITASAVHEFDIVPWLLGSPVTEVSWHAPLSPRSAGMHPAPLALQLSSGTRN